MGANNTVRLKMIEYYIIEIYLGKLFHIEIDSYINQLKLKMISTKSFYVSNMHRILCFSQNL